MNNKHSEDYLTQKMIASALGLINDYDVPLIISYRNRKNKQIFFGSTKSKNKFSALYERDESWKNIFTEDGEDQRNTQNRPYLQINPNNNCHRVVEGQQEVPFLPFPLDKMNFKEKADYVKDAIYQNYLNRQAGTKKHPRFKDETFRATWWPEQEVPWMTMDHFHSGKARQNFIGHGTLSEFLTRCIHLILQGNRMVLQNIMLECHMLK